MTTIHSVFISSLTHDTLLLTSIEGNKDHYYIEETIHYDGKKYVGIVCSGGLNYCLSYVYTRFNGCYDTETVM